VRPAVGDVAPGPEPGDESHQKSSLEGVTGSWAKRTISGFVRLASRGRLASAAPSVEFVERRARVTSFTIALGLAGERRWPALRAHRGCAV